MTLLSTVQDWIVLLLGVLAIAMEAYALVHAVRQRSDAFVAAGKQTKPVWLAILGVALLLGVASLGAQGLLFLGLLGVVAAGVYLADVKPAIEQLVGGRGSRW